MFRRARILLPVLLAFALLWLSVPIYGADYAADYAADEGNLLKNPGFEYYTGGDGVADQWKKLINGVDSTFEVVESPVKSGLRAQKMSALGMILGTSARLYQEFPVTPNQKFELAGSMRVDSLVRASAMFYVEFYDDKETYIGGKFVEQLTASETYITFEEHGVVPANAVTGAVHISMQGTWASSFQLPGSGTIYIDDLSLKMDKTPLEVIETMPANGEQEADPNQPVTVTFNKPVAAGIQFDSISLKRSEDEIQAIVTVEQQTLRITPTSPLMEQGTYTVMIPKDAVLDLEGTGLSSPIMLTFITRDNSNLLRNGGFERYTGNNGLGDYWRSRWSEGVQASYEIINTYVGSGTNAQKISAIGLSEGKSVSLSQVFSLAGNDKKRFEIEGLISVTQLNNAEVILYVDFYDENGAYIGGEFMEQKEDTYSYVKMTEQGSVPSNAVEAAVYVTIEGLAPNGTGTVSIDNLAFKTIPAGLKVIGTSPANMEEDVNPRQSITVTFNKPFNTGTGLRSIQLKSGELNADVRVVQVGLQALAIIPLEPLEPQRTFTLTIPKDAVIDDKGQGLTDPLILSFTTRGDSNLLRNGGFEQYTGIDGVADYWMNRVSDGAEGTFEVVDMPVLPRSSSQKISASGLSEGAAAKLYQYIEINPNQSFELSGALRIDELNQAVVLVYVDFYDETGAYVSGKFIELTETTEGFITLNEQGVIPQNAIEAGVYVAIEGIGANGSGKVFVDEISLQTGPLTTEPEVEEERNLLENADFEEYTGLDGIADQWFEQADENTFNSYEVVSNPVSRGQSSQRISATGLQQGVTAAVYQQVDVVSGLNYKLQGSLRIESMNGAAAVLRVDFYAATGENVGFQLLEQTAVTEGYVILSDQGIVPENAVKAVVRIGIESYEPSGEGTFYADDLFIGV